MKENAIALWVLTAVNVVTFVSILVVVLCAARGKLGPNFWAGLRTPATMHDPQTWQAAHQSSVGIVVAATVLEVLAIVFSMIVFYSWNREDPALYIQGGTIIAFSLMIVWAGIHANQVAKQLLR